MKRGKPPRSLYREVARVNSPAGPRENVAENLDRLIAECDRSTGPFAQREHALAAEMREFRKDFENALAKWGPEVVSLVDRALQIGAATERRFVDAAGIGEAARVGFKTMDGGRPSEDHWELIFCATERIADGMPARNVVASVVDVCVDGEPVTTLKERQARKVLQMAGVLSLTQQQARDALQRAKLTKPVVRQIRAMKRGEGSQAGGVVPKLSKGK